MRQTLQGTSIVLGLLLLMACSRSERVEQTVITPVAPAPSSAPMVYDAMMQAIIPESNTIWELAGSLYDDNGNIDSNKLTVEQWQQLKGAATVLAESSKRLAGEQIKVAAEGVKIQDEGAPGAAGAAEVQAAIDADPQGFKAEALVMAAIADGLADAAERRDGKKADDASTRLSEVCGACHAKFWYPNQKQLSALNNL